MILVLPLFSIVGALFQALTSVKTTYAALSMACMILYFIYQTTDVNVDYLTGILNRRGLDWKLQEKMNSTSSGKNFSVIMFDIDHFKEINDTLGHSEGDYAIQLTAEILVDTFGEGTIVGRLGGDEFCVVSDIVDRKILDERISDVRKRLGRTKRRRGWNDAVDISSGIEIYDFNSGMSKEQFMSLIDEKMYKEKESHHEATKIADN